MVDFVVQFGLHPSLDFVDVFLFRIRRECSLGSQRKIQSPFEEEERQLSILQGVSSFKSYCSTSGKLFLVGV